MLPPIFFQNDDVLSARIVHYGIDKHELFAFLTYSRKTYQLDHSFLFLFVSGMIEGRDYQLVKERMYSACPEEVVHEPAMEEIR